MRRKIKRTWREAAGFTLVELVVVIAILGILAGGGSVAYSGYVKNANMKADMTNVANVVRAVDVAGKSHGFPIDEVSQVSSDGLQVPVGFLILSNGKIMVDGEDKGYVYELLPDGATANADLLNQILTATYGADYDASMQLQSNEWTESSISTLYADANEMYSSVQTLANLLDSVDSTLVSMGYMDNTYNSGIDVAVSAAKNIVEKYPTEDAFASVWKNVGTNANYTFGLQTYGQETYIAVRRGYNEAVAGYIESTTAGTHDTFYWKRSGLRYSKTATTEAVTTHKDAISTYGTTLLGLTISDCICAAVFDSDECSGYIQGSLKDSTQWCETCKAAVAAYPTSAAADTDARAFYKTMKTLAADTEEINKAVEDGDWTYFNNYVSSFSGLYSDLEEITNAQESCIVITVYYESESKELLCEVSPIGADLRNAAE